MFGGRSVGARYSETLGVANENVPTEANPAETPEEIGEKVAKDVWRRYGRALATEEAVIRFIDCIAERSGVRHKKSGDGLLILSAASGVLEGPQVPVDEGAAARASGETSTCDGETADPLPAVDQHAAAREGGSEPAA